MDGNLLGVRHDNSCTGVHANSSGTIACGNSRVGRGHDEPGGTKPLSTRTRCKVWRPAVGESAPLQQASGSLQGEAWLGHVQSSSLKISLHVEIGPGCVVAVSRLPTPDFVSSPGCGGVVRSGWSGPQWGKQHGLGCVFSCCVLSLQRETGSGRDRATQRSRSRPLPRVLVDTCVGKAHLSSPKLGSGAGHCFPDCGGPSHLL